MFSYVIAILFSKMVASGDCLLLPFFLLFGQKFEVLFSIWIVKYQVFLQDHLKIYFDVQSNSFPINVCSAEYVPL